MQFASWYLSQAQTVRNWVLELHNKNKIQKQTKPDARSENSIFQYEAQYEMILCVGEGGLYILKIANRWHIHASGWFSYVHETRFSFLNVCNSSHISA